MKRRHGINTSHTKTAQNSVQQVEQISNNLINQDMQQNLSQITVNNLSIAEVIFKK